MKIILANGVELNPIMVTGEKRTVQGATRDTLTFMFSGNEDIVNLNNIFNDTACEIITIVEGENEYLHKGYTVRAELSKKPVEVTKATIDTDAVYEERITVSMSQRTYQETQMAELQEALELILSGETEV